MWPIFWFLAIGTVAASTNLLVEKRQQSWAQHVNNLHQQIQQYQKSISDCRQQVLALTNQARPSPTWSGVDSWRWQRSHTDDGQQQRHLTQDPRTTRETSLNTNVGYLQQVLQEQARLLSQCSAQLQSLLRTQGQAMNPQQMAQNLLQNIQAGASSLRSCVSLGGLTSADLPVLYRYLANGGFLPSQHAVGGQQNAPPTASFFPWLLWSGFEFDDRRRTVTPQMDWSRVVAERQQWQTYVLQEVSKCWQSLGRLPNGSVPVTSVTPPLPPPPPNFTPPLPPPPPNFTPPLPPPPPNFTPPLPPPPPNYTPPPPPPPIEVFPVRPPSTTPPITRTQTSQSPITTTSSRTTSATPRPTASTTTTSSIVLPTTTSPPRTTSVSPPTSSSTISTSTFLPNTTITASITTLSTSLNSTLTVFASTGPGLFATTISPLMTTSPCY